MEKYNLLLKFPKSMEQDIRDMAWKKRMTMTQYIRGLVEEDLKREGSRA